MATATTLRFLAVLPADVWAFMGRERAARSYISFYSPVVLGCEPKMRRRVIEQRIKTARLLQTRAAEERNE